MISVVCVFNNKDILEKRLYPSLYNQNHNHDLVLLDNRNNRFDSAAIALNYGAQLAIGDWIIFAHQDIELLSDNWIESVEFMLNSFKPSGWVGVAGRDEHGVFKGFMIDRSALFGHIFDGFDPVQTLDECLLIHKRLPDDNKYFDEGVPGWHAYGVDACCQALTSGKQNYVISLPVWHDSPSTNLAGLDESHKYVWEKHRVLLSEIYTTCGILTDKGEQSNSRITFRDRIDYRIKKYHRILFGVSDSRIYTFAEKLESLTCYEDVIVCLHSEHWIEKLEASAFVPQPQCKRSIYHKFTGLNAINNESACVVVWHDLSMLMSKATMRILMNNTFLKRIILCIKLKHLWLHPLMWKKVISQAEYSCLTLNNFDNSPVLIISLMRS